MTRFSPMSGATSATVPMAAIFRSDSIEIFFSAAADQLAAELEGDADTRQLLERIGTTVLLRVQHGRCFGKSAGRQVVVGDDHVDAALDRKTDRLDARDSAVDRDHELHVPRGEDALEHFDLQPVSVDEAMRHDERGSAPIERSTVCSSTIEVTPSTS